MKIWRWYLRPPCAYLISCNIHYQIVWGLVISNAPTKFERHFKTFHQFICRQSLTRMKMREPLIISLTIKFESSKWVSRMDENDRSSLGWLSGYFIIPLLKGQLESFTEWWFRYLETLIYRDGYTRAGLPVQEWDFPFETLFKIMNDQSWCLCGQQYACCMMTSSDGNIFRVTGPLCGEFTGSRWIPLTKASDAELWCILWFAPEQTAEQTIETPVIWDAIALNMTAL